MVRVVVVVVGVVVVNVVVVDVQRDPSTETATIGLYPSGPLEPSDTLAPKLLTWACSVERYRNGDFSSPAMNLDSTPPPLWVTIWATDTPTDAEPPSWPSNRTLHTVAPPTPWVQSASTSRPKLPFVCSTPPPISTSMPWSPSCTQPFSAARSKYKATRAESTGPLPFVCRLARRLVLHPTLVAATSSTNTKMPRLTLLRKLASLPDTSVLWSASSAFWLCFEDARIAFTCGPSPPAKLIPR